MSADESITSLPDAVAKYGALPMPAGPAPLSAEREREIRSLDLLALVSDRVAPVISGHLAALLGEIDELRAQRERRRVRLVALQNDALSMRGSLSPMGEGRKVPFPLGETLTPAVDWLIGRVAELEAERHSTNEALSDAAEALREKQQREAIVTQFVAARAEYITAIRNCHPDNGHDYNRWQGHAAARRQLAESLGLPVAWPPEETAKAAVADGEHYPHVHHSYRLGHDLPEAGGNR